MFVFHKIGNFDTLFITVSEIVHKKEDKTRVKYNSNTWSSIIIGCWILILNFNLGFPTSKSLTLMSRSRLKVGARIVQTASCRSNSWLGYFTFGPVSVSAAIPNAREGFVPCHFPSESHQIGPLLRDGWSSATALPVLLSPVFGRCQSLFTGKDLVDTPIPLTAHTQFSCNVFLRFKSVTCFTGLVSLA